MTEREDNYSAPESYRGKIPFAVYNHLEITKVSLQESEMRLVVNPDSLNLMGMVHGGLLYAMADTIAGITARADGRVYVTQNATVHFVRNVSSGTVIARGILIRRGRRAALLRGIVESEDKTLLADVTLSMFCTD